MAIIRIIVDGGKSMVEMVKEMKSCKVLSKTIRVISAFILLLTWGLQYWDILGLESLTIPRFERVLRNTLTESVSYVLIVWFIYYSVGKTILWKVADCFNRKEKEKLFPLWFTFDDCLESILSFYFLVYVVNIFVEFVNGYVVQTYNVMYYLAFIYLFSQYVRWVYKTNSREWNKFTKKYTGYYDNKGNPIPVDGYVIYYGELYEVYLGSRFDGSDKTKEWKISSNKNRFKDEIPLSEAVKDINGRLILEKHSLE